VFQNVLDVEFVSIQDSLKKKHRLHLSRPARQAAALVVVVVVVVVLPPSAAIHNE